MLSRRLLPRSVRNIGTATRKTVMRVLRKLNKHSNNVDLLSIDHFLILTDKDGIELDMNKLLHNVINQDYSINLKNRLSILMKTIEIAHSKYVDELNPRKKFTPIQSIYFQIILLQRQLIDAILHELVMIKIANEIIANIIKLDIETLFENNKSDGIRGGGIFEELFLLILGTIILTFASNQVSMNDGINGIINKDKADLHKLRESTLATNREQLEKIFAVSSVTTILNSKGGETFNSVQQGIILQQLTASLNQINEKYQSYRQDIIEECRRSFDAVAGVDQSIAVLGSIQELLVYDAANIEPEMLTELTVTEATQQIGQDVAAVIPDMVGAFSTGVWNGMFGTKEIVVSEEQSTQKDEDNRIALNAHIEKTANSLVESQNEAFSIIAGRLFMDIQCSNMPTGKYTALKLHEDGHKIAVKTEYATQNTGKIIDSLALLMAKIKYLEKGSDEQTKKVLKLHREKVFQLLRLANYGPFLVIPSDSESVMWDAGKLVVDAESKFRSYEIEVLKLFEDFSETKAHSEELLRAISSLAKIDRDKRREMNEEFWKELEVKWEVAERVAKNVKETVSNVGEGVAETVADVAQIAADAIIDTGSHIIDKSLEPFFKLALMGATGIGLMILFYCAVPLIRLYISTHTPVAPAAPAAPVQRRRGRRPPQEEERQVLRIPRAIWNRVLEEQPHGENPQHAGGKSQKRRTSKKSKTYKRNRLFVKRK
jgi:hypothetical protein